ncbi:hypothetical protein IW262DRAFT_206911 [Armillaria fumosa]|nr:hypothetical protein IW262DRAFT_206911 [Armillaria fumosa]
MAALFLYRAQPEHRGYSGVFDIGCQPAVLHSAGCQDLTNLVSLRKVSFRFRRQYLDILKCIIAKCFFFSGGFFLSESGGRCHDFGFAFSYLHLTSHFSFQFDEFDVIRMVYASFYLASPPLFLSFLSRYITFPHKVVASRKPG